MSKNLEKEYRDFFAKDMPDLWDRIESGLEPKQAMSSGRKRQRRYRIWGMAAACLCLAVTGFGLRTLLWPGYGAMSDGNSGMAENAGGMEALDAEMNGMCEAPREDDAMIAPNVGMAGEEFLQVSVLQVRILEVFQAEGGTVYTAEIVESEELPLQEEVRIALHDGRKDGETLEAGTVYRLDVVITADSDGARIYSISGVE